MRYQIDGISLSIFELGSIIVKHYSLNSKLITKIKSNNLKQVALRPKNSTLSIDRVKKDINFVPTSFKQSLNQLL